MKTIFYVCGVLGFLIVASCGKPEPVDTGKKTPTKKLRKIVRSYKKGIIQIPINKNKMAQIVKEYSRGMIRILQSETTKAEGKGEYVDVIVKQKYTQLINGKTKEDFIAYDSRLERFRFGLYNVEGKSMNMNGIYIFGYAPEHCFEHRNISVNDVLGAKSIRDIARGKKGIDCL